MFASTVSLTRAWTHPGWHMGDYFPAPIAATRTRDGGGWVVVAADTLGPWRDANVRQLQPWGLSAPVLFNRFLGKVSGGPGGVFVSWKIARKSETEAVVEISDWEGAARRRRSGDPPAARRQGLGRRRAANHLDKLIAPIATPMRDTPVHTLLLTGSPGVGKTTLVRRIIEGLPAIRPRGFYTEELRERGERRGFRAVSFGDIERIMAHVDLQGPHRVGKYVVDLAAIDEIARTSLSLNRRHRVYVIDEIGRMECLSRAFVDAVSLLLASEAVIIATIGIRGGGFIAETKARDDAELWQVTRANREELVARGIRWIQERLE